MKRKVIDQERLKELLIYDPEDGSFKWVVGRAGTAKSGVEAGSPISGGYINIMVDKVVYKAHRLAFFYMTGSCPDWVDHINGDPFDNRWANLRGATLSQNAHNRKKNKNNSSGVKGVSWSKSSRKWVARLWIDGKRVTIGSYPDLIGAELAIRKAREENHMGFSNHG